MRQKNKIRHQSRRLCVKPFLKGTTSSHIVDVSDKGDDQSSDDYVAIESPTSLPYGPNDYDNASIPSELDDDDNESEPSEAGNASEHSDAGNESHLRH